MREDDIHAGDVCHEHRERRRSSPVKPALNTVYRANWRNAKSAQLTAKVMPALSLKRVRARRFSASLVAGQSFIGKYVVLQRYA